MFEAEIEVVQNEPSIVSETTFQNIPDLSGCGAATYIANHRRRNHHKDPTENKLVTPQPYQVVRALNTTVIKLWWSWIWLENIIESIGASSCKHLNFPKIVVCAIEINTDRMQRRKIWLRRSSHEHRSRESKRSKKNARKSKGSKKSALYHVKLWAKHRENKRIVKWKSFSIDSLYALLIEMCLQSYAVTCRFNL